jgi:hypothetical protein
MQFWHESAHLARSAFDDDVSTLAKSRALHGISQGGASIGRLAGVIFIKTFFSPSAGRRTRSARVA